ncbi:MAG TPA: LPXTG cell wall anchor domain-containing protein [Thermoleophilaceae bacterium]
MSEHPSSPPPDPSGIEEPHDILAAEEFGIGTRDERFPPDPTGITEPHDVLAAEEFPMPAGSEPHVVDTGSSGRSWLPLAGLLAAITVVLLLRRRR